MLAALPFLGRAEAQERFDLEPYQMVRSLELVQDRIAAGDEAALPMQRKLLEMIDAKLLATPPAGFEDPRNFDALLVYAIERRQSRRPSRRVVSRHRSDATQRRARHRHPGLSAWPARGSAISRCTTSIR